MSFLTLLQSVVDVAPVAFVKIGQDQSGAIDFRITPNALDPLRTEVLISCNFSPFNSYSTEHALD